MVGENMSVVLNTTIPSSTLKKKHLGCAYHHVREAVAGEFILYGHIKSEFNLADIGTKPLGFIILHRLIDPYLFRYPKHLIKEKKKQCASEWHDWRGVTEPNCVCSGEYEIVNYLYV